MNENRLVPDASTRNGTWDLHENWGFYTMFPVSTDVLFASGDRNTKTPECGQHERGGFVSETKIIPFGGLKHNPVAFEVLVVKLGLVHKTKNRLWFFDKNSRFSFLYLQFRLC